MFNASFRLLAPCGQPGMSFHAYACFRLMFTHWDELGKACESSADPHAAAAAADLRTLRYRALFRAMLHQQTPSSLPSSSALSSDVDMTPGSVVALVQSLCGTGEHAAMIVEQQLKCRGVSLSESDFIEFASKVFPALGLSSFGHIKHLTQPHPRPVVFSRSTDTGGGCGAAAPASGLASGAHTSRAHHVDEGLADIEEKISCEAAMHVRAGTVVETDLRETVDWRGVLVARETRAYADANRIIARTKAMMMKTYSEADAIFDAEWPHALSSMIGRKSTLSCARVMKRLSREAKRIVQLQPMVVRAPAPAKVFGDIHGQLRDLLLLFREHGFPSNKGGDVECTAYVFNGDFVDRGSHQVEVACLVLALKVAFPSKVFLLRGNHEFPEQNEHMGACGFKAACEQLFDASCNESCSDDEADGDDDHKIDGLGCDVYRSVHSCFEWLPFACVVADRLVGFLSFDFWAFQPSVGQASQFCRFLLCVSACCVCTEASAMVSGICWLCVLQFNLGGSCEYSGDWSLSDLNAIQRPVTHDHCK